MVIYEKNIDLFESIHLKKQYIWLKNIAVQIYFILLWTDLCWNFSSLLMDASNIRRIPTVHTVKTNERVHVRRSPSLFKTSRDVSKCTRMATMPILASEALLCKNIKIQVTKFYPPNEYWTQASDSKSNTLLSGLTWHLLVRLRL